MDLAAQARKAEALRKLHGGPRVLVLPNAWDVASACVLEELGYPAIATTSAGVAFALGYPDGQRISRDEMLDVVGRIARAVSVPVTADMESGYGITPADMAETGRAIVNAGAVGLNFEDVTGDTESSQVEISVQVEKIRSIREASAAMGVSLVINARTDVYLMPIGPEATRFERTVTRLRAYRRAGADCVFVPGLVDRGLIEKLVKAVDAPLNILVTPGCPSIPELQKLGVARASIGSGVMRATLGLVRRIGKELLETGTYSAVFEGSIPYAQIDEMMSRLAPNSARKAHP
jgi:2-methylisocitrate lyase-like PEP mutase family enzyme